MVNGTYNINETTQTLHIYVLILSFISPVKIHTWKLQFLYLILALLFLIIFGQYFSVESLLTSKFPFSNYNIVIKLIGFAVCRVQVFNQFHFSLSLKPGISWRRKPRPFFDIKKQKKLRDDELRGE